MTISTPRHGPCLRSTTLALVSVLATTGCGESSPRPATSDVSSGAATGAGGTAADGSATGSGGSPASSGTGGGSGGRSAFGCDSPRSCTLFVSTSGDDASAGTEDDPFGSPQQAADLAVPGDVICIRGGSYPGVTLKTSGTPDAPIVIRSHPGETAVLDGVGLFAGWGVAIGWIEVADLEIIQTQGSPEDSGQCVYLNAAHDVVLRRNTIHDCYGQGILGNGWNVLIDSNQIFRAGLFSVDDPMHGNQYHGAYIAGTAFTFVNNSIHSNAAYGIQVAGYPYVPDDPNSPPGPEYMGASGFLIANNVFAFQQNRSGVVVWQPDAKDNTIVNNVFFENSQHGPHGGGTNGIDFYYCGAGNVVANNLYYGSGSAVADTADGASHVESAAVLDDPLFVDAASWDFHLLPDSPAIDAATAEGAPDHDAECNARPSGRGYDIGAFER